MYALMLGVEIPATEEGICAAYRLEKKHGIQTNLMLVTGVAHAAACVEAGPSTITMFVDPVSPCIPTSK